MESFFLNFQSTGALAVVCTGPVENSYEKGATLTEATLQGSLKTDTLPFISNATISSASS
jgi:hypothetical protein